MALTAAQCRAGRALLAWTQADLEAASTIARKTIAAFELGIRQPLPVTLAALRHAIEEAGVDFIEENGGGAGARLRRPAADTTRLGEPTTMLPAEATAGFGAEECRRARTAVGLSRTRLAALAGVTETTLTKLERSGEVRADLVAAIRQALDAVGAQFIAKKRGGQGRLEIADLGAAALTKGHHAEPRSTRERRPLPPLISEPPLRLGPSSTRKKR
ncbi:helix-turn-helix domain-containing protein [Falsiroseomonas sp. HW251]|uniref:helix-turn-helix domain-containing protein n=1 Tax=Falsiroseomonas sp. HW251 TaxID=3390998 RepID=UPI003D310328